MATRRDLTKKYAKQYRTSSKKEKGRLLDELCASTGWSRVNARRAIRQAGKRVGSAKQQTRKPRARKYSYDALKVLEQVWTLSGEPSGKYFAVVMKDLLERLVRFNELGTVTVRATPVVLEEVMSMSAATIDRYLAPIKATRYPEAKSTTSPSRILRSSIPTRTCMDGFDDTPGWLEIDTVAHCGHTTKGEYLITINATDPVTGWTLTRTVKNKAFIHMKAGMEWIRTHLPYPLLGIDFDNGSEFLNWGIIAWADSHNILVTRSRAYKHNDNAYVEQRNGDWVRKHGFRYRYETTEELALLNQLWAQVSIRKNHLLPCVKAVDWVTTSTGRRKRVYDKPTTPYDRVVASGIIPPARAGSLAKSHHSFNPAAVTRRINSLQRRLITSAKERTTREPITSQTA